MKRLLFTLIILTLFVKPVLATEFPQEYIPKEAELYLSENPTGFWDDLKRVLMDALSQLRPDITQAVQTCLRVIGVLLLGSVLSSFSATSGLASRLVMTVSASILFLDSGGTLMELGEDTVNEIYEYGKMLLPILTGSLAAQGAVTTSAGLYTGTVLFSTLLNSAVSKLLIPMLYLYLCVCIANSALVDDSLRRIRAFIKWLLTWSLKTLLYLFTGYMSITGVISGSVDASALKATKLAISGAVPVVGNILSDASETILLSASMMKNSVGAYGLVVIISILIGPFLKIGIQYILMKSTAAACSVFAPKDITGLLDDYSSVMGYVLAMTGVASVLLMVSIVCMMKGVG